MSKAEEEADRIVNEYYLSPLSINKADSIECAITHVKGILSCQYDLPSRGFYEHWNEVLTILKNK